MIPSVPQAGEPIAVEHPELARSWQFTAVAVCFVVSGLVAAWDPLFSDPPTIQGGGGGRQFRVHLGLLATPIGIGLLRHRPGWRVAALVFSAMTALASLLGTALLLAGRGQLTVWTPGAGPSEVSETWIGFLLMGPTAAVSIWIMYVLLRPDIRMRFRDRLPDRPWIEWAVLAAVLLLAIPGVIRS